MQTSAPSRSSFIGLIRALTGDIRTFIRQEIQLAKTEITEKIASFGRNAVSLAVGGVIAYAGLIVLLIGVGLLVAWGLQAAGLEPLIANFLGLIIIGVVVAGTGAALLLKGIKALSQSSLALERTLHTLQELRTAEPAKPAEQKSEPEPQASSSEIQARVEATENRMGENLDELGRRLSPRHINRQIQRRIQTNPYRSGVIAMVAGLFSALVLRRKFTRT